MHDCQEERGSLTRRQLGEKSAIEVVGKSYHHPRRRKDGRMEHSDSFLSLSDSYPPGKEEEGRETFLLPFSYRVMKSLLRGRRHRRRRSRSFGRSATENRSIDRHR